MSEFVTQYHEAEKKKKQDLFIARWRAYWGVKGFARYMVRFLALGVLAAPLVMWFLNPNIWRQLAQSDVQRAVWPVVLMVTLFSIVPCLILGCALWWSHRTRFMALTTEQERYLPFVARLWRAGEQRWYRGLNAVATLMLISLCASFPLLLAHNAPSTWVLPFECSALFLAIYTLYRVFIGYWARWHDTPLFVPTVFKVVLSVCLMAALCAWLWFIVKNV